ncbi:MAG TPA: PQQ-binding-like beta-propeller repeat protein [Pirellulales bacterium]|nr:PQQ-binding-like beta-propeller repeat protein [Pirellulales bacterium]
MRLARDWSARPPRLIWRVSIGQGWGGFAVADGLAFTQEQRGDLEAVVCYELATGRQRWIHTDAVCFRSPTAGDGPRATPAIGGADVYTLGATGILNCLDVRTGRRRWSVDVLADNRAGNLFHGLSGSPLVVGEAVLVSAGGAHGRSLAAYDRRTGSRLWSGGDDAAGYGSPLLCRVAGQRQIVILNRPGLTAHDPRTGKVLWSFPWSNVQETNCSQPVPLGVDRVLVSTGYGKGSGLLAVRRTNDQWSAEAIWTSPGLKCKFCSAVVRAGFAYGLDDGVLACLDLVDGRRRWRAGRYGHGQLLLVDDLLLIQAESGEVVLVKATPDEHRELARFAALEGKTWNYPALAGTLLLVRNDHEAACYELPLQQDHALLERTPCRSDSGGSRSVAPTLRGGDLPVANGDRDPRHGVPGLL